MTLKHSAPLGKRNIVPPAIKQQPEYKAFFDGISIIIAAIKAQRTKPNSTVVLPKTIDMTARSNLDISVQDWFDHNYTKAHGVTIEWGG